MFSLSVDLKQMAADFAAIEKAAEKATKRNLLKCGAYCRKIAMNSMKSVSDKHKNGSKPGEPPHSVLGKIKYLIRFEWDDATKSCVVGPTSTGSGTRVPGILENGGVTQVKVTDKKGRTKFVSVRIDARPFMQPAMIKTLPKMRELFRDCIKQPDVR